jgi:ubiquinone/menaquinone biosynthesis C-methylase UbiE
MTNKIKDFKDTIAWYDANAEKYASNLEKVPNLDLINKFADAVGENGRVLDAGCAAGRDSTLLKEKGLEPIGVDLSESLLVVARKKHPDIQFKHANFLNLPFKDEIFDGVWAHASLLHLETTEEVGQALKEFHRVLKQGGVIHVFVKQQQGEEKIAVISDTLSGHDRFFQWFTKNEIKSLLEDTGFTLQLIEDNYKDSADREEVKWIVALARK